MPGPRGIGEPPPGPPDPGISSRVRLSILHCRKDALVIVM